jgi:hypothetical protein
MNGIVCMLCFNVVSQSQNMNAPAAIAQVFDTESHHDRRLGRVPDLAGSVLR